jgi:hypothetical protein
VNISCSICDHPFVSVLLPQENALKEVTENLIKHVMQRHRREWGKVTAAVLKLQLTVAWLFSFDSLATVPLDETWVLAEIEKNQDIVRQLLGFDVAEEEEDGEEKPPGVVVDIESGKVD